MSHLLATCQIDQTHLGYLHLGGEPGILVLQLDEDLQDGVRPAALLVGVGGVLGSVAVTWRAGEVTDGVAFRTEQTYRR